MLRYWLIIAAVFFMSGAVLANGPTTTPVAPSALPTGRRDEPFLGINLESLRDYSRQFMFIDAMKSSRRFGSVKWPYDQKGIVNPRDGSPGDDCGTLVMTEVKNINGVYHFSCTGRCALSTPGSPATVRNLIYHRENNRTEAEVVVAAPPDKSITLSLVFTGTDGGIKDVKLLRPGYPDDKQIFTGEFLRALQPFGAIRFMDFLKTNNSTLVKWSDRCKPSDAQYTIKGGPYEVAIDLGNLAGKDIWLNVPAMADDDFVQQLGALVRQRLRPDLHCYIEYSNEVWNGIFHQARENEKAAEAAVASGDATLSINGTDKNIYYWGWRRVAERGVQIKKLLGDDPRFRLVLASQLGYAPPGRMLKMQLDYVNQFFGPPGKYFYAVAGAPYFSPGKDATDPTKKKYFTQRNDITVDSICECMLTRVATSAGPNVQAFHALAKEYGLKSFAYEGGVDMQQYAVGYNAKYAAQYDPRMGRAVEGYLDHYYTGGGDAMFYFVLTCKYSKFGYWGLTEDIDDLATPKYQAAVRVSEMLNAKR